MSMLNLSREYNEKDTGWKKNYGDESAKSLLQSNHIVNFYNKQHSSEIDIDRKLIFFFAMMCVIHL